MRKTLLTAALIAASSPAFAQADPAIEVSEKRLQSDVESMVGFGTRHTLSSQDDPFRGIGAALNWADREFQAMNAKCDGCLTVVRVGDTVQGRRIAEPTRVENSVAIQIGSTRPKEVIIVQGHIDSRVTDVLNATDDAPGANDNASGSALVLESARVLSQNRYPTTIIYALLSGEEQGLYGGRILAKWVKEQGYTVKAVLNNDVVGNSCGSDGYCDGANVRVFSEGPRADLTDSVRAAQRRNGGENDSPSRNLSRWIDSLADDFEGGLNVRQIWRTDRMGRGGDQIPFLEAGYPAVRFSVAVEDYEHQHQDLRTEDSVTYGDTPEEMDFNYLAKVTHLNVRAIDLLSKTPMPPAPVAQAAVRTFTEIKWEPVDGATGYRIYRRRTDEGAWEERPVAVTGETEKVLDGVRGDDWLFGVSSVGEGGFESPIASAVPAGAFAPLPKPQNAVGP